MWSTMDKNDYGFVLSILTLVLLPNELCSCLDKHIDLFERFYKQLCAILYVLHLILRMRMRKVVEKDIAAIII